MTFRAAPSSRALLALLKVLLTPTVANPARTATIATPSKVSRSVMPAILFKSRPAYACCAQLAPRRRRTT